MNNSKSQQVWPVNVKIITDKTLVRCKISLEELNATKCEEENVVNALCWNLLEDTINCNGEKLIEISGTASEYQEDFNYFMTEIET